MGKILDEMLKWMNSPKGQKELEKERKRMQFIIDITDKWIEKFHNIGIDKRSEIIDRIIAKYESDKYYWREMKIGCEPRCPLYWFLFEYAGKYGEELPFEENNPFPHHLRLIDGKYKVRQMFGQGTVVDVWNVSKEQKQ